ncbi:rhamnan synthesis F family protein [Methylobacterium sp. ID0610]|uniref:rhamnan synthesis F family protein n=1 Tax=Methylobacterium carpenticola TaxID=3344827 RepID=UPI00368EB753
MRIAVVAHCHYAEQAHAIVRRLAAVPDRHDLFVSTSDAALAETLAGEIEAVPAIDDCQIVIAPNRGRNFAPFLVEFREDLKRYDLICHVHTKQSRHRGDALTGWGEYLIDHLIGDGPAWSRAVALFRSEPRCGLAYPDAYAPLPFWSRHWLGNFAIARLWAERAGVPIRPGFVHYPVGGMFWARPAAIAPLLDDDWSYADFPDEEGQIDGTMQHAIERLVGAVCHHTGYDHFARAPGREDFVKVQDGVFPHDENFRADKLAERVAASRYVSFDLFALAAGARDEIESAALERVSRSLIAAKVIASPEPYLLHRRLIELRSRFEYRHAGQIAFGELVRALSLALRGPDAALLRAEADHVAGMIAPDARVTEIYRAAAAAGRPILIVADCVYGRGWIADVLRRLDLPDPAHCFCTSDVPGLRADGTVWKTVAEAVGAGAWEITHFGKDVAEDYLLPQRSKVFTIHVP